MDAATLQFLKAFDRIEAYLRTTLKTDGHVTYYSMIEQLSKSNAAVRRSSRILKRLGDLRNLFSHQDREMAIPSPSAIAEVEQMANQLESPPLLMSLFSMNVETCSLGDPVGKAARLMHEHVFSQLPVMDSGRLVGLLTSETIARWLATKLKDGMDLVAEEPVESVLRHQESESKYKLVSRTATVFDGLKAFDDALHKGDSLEALLITNSGSATEALLGISTPYDIPKMLKSI